MIKKWYLIFLLFIIGCSNPLMTNGIPNLNTVSSTQHIYRGGQPTNEGWDYLKSLGVTTVIKLNELSEGSDAYAESIGMKVYYYPFSISQQIGLKVIPDSLVNGAVNKISNNTYIHCEHGQDRTGLIVACYRLKTGYTKEQAQQEMLQLGFHKLLIGLWDYWEDIK
jgi:tyrosine-protein phosphatase SIW14